MELWVPLVFCRSNSLNLSYFFFTEFFTLDVFFFVGDFCKDSTHITMFSHHLGNMFFWISS